MCKMKSFNFFHQHGAVLENTNYKWNFFSIPIEGCRELYAAEIREVYYLVPGLALIPIFYVLQHKYKENGVSLDNK